MKPDLLSFTKPIVFLIKKAWIEQFLRVAVKQLDYQSYYPKFLSEDPIKKMYYIWQNILFRFLVFWAIFYHVYWTSLYSNQELMWLYNMDQYRNCTRNNFRYFWWKIGLQCSSTTYNLSLILIRSYWVFCIRNRY